MKIHKKKQLSRTKEISIASLAVLVGNAQLLITVEKQLSIIAIQSSYLSEKQFSLLFFIFTNFVCSIIKCGNHSTKCESKNTERIKNGVICQNTDMCVECQKYTSMNNSVAYFSSLSLYDISTFFPYQKNYMSRSESKASKYRLYCT